jgi:DNA primase
MAVYTKECLEVLRQRIDLVEVLSPYVDLKRAGASFKACCPFHDEKTPSFVVQRGDAHYHCYGCGAHGDAIAFLMNSQKMSFSEAVETLADKFSVTLETLDKGERQNFVDKPYLKSILEIATEFFHFYLLHTDEGHVALSYLYNRGFDLEFIRDFKIGLAPKNIGVFQKFMHQKKISNKNLEEVGLLKKNGKDFFSDRIVIPIHEAIGSVIGFSARKYKEETFGPKYINTPETILFKKSKLLFGLNYCRKRIAKERRAIIVEGQFDALSLIHMGFNISVAGQGTAFGQDHVKELSHLGINTVYLAFDADKAGNAAAIKVGDLFQKEAIEVFVMMLPEDSDPDTILKEKGPDEWMKLLQTSIDYLTFLVNNMSKTININSPSGKNEMVESIIKRIKEWDHPLMVHESLKKLAKLTRIPENVIGIQHHETPKNVYIKKSASVSSSAIDPDMILETDLLRWLFIMGQEDRRYVDIAKKNMQKEHFRIATCRRLYERYIESCDNNLPLDLLSLSINVDDTEEKLFLSEMLQKKVNVERSFETFVETIKQILDRHWLEQREDIKMKIHSGKCSDDEVLELAKKFDDIKRQKPQVIVEETP